MTNALNYFRLCCKKRARKQKAMAWSTVEEIHGSHVSHPFLGAEPDAKWKQAQSHDSICQ